MLISRYRVRKYRSVQDSGWITLERVNALLGENESGKTNLLLPLWKLRPASGGEIDLLVDAPRGEYTEIRETPDEDKPIFIEAEFKLNESEMTKLATKADCDPEWVSCLSLKRRFDGQYFIGFPNAAPTKSCERSRGCVPIQEFINFLDGMTPNKTDARQRALLSDKADALLTSLSEKDGDLSLRELQEVRSEVDGWDVTRASKTGGIRESRRKCIEELSSTIDELSKESPSNNKEIRELALSMVPSFIYYSNYGNLDSQIYLPKVIDNIGKKLGSEKEEAKARTLKVLFEYVRLNPKEILEMGRDLTPQEASTEGAVDKKARQKHERAVLLESASSSMTKSFSEWWRQGNYTFRFLADGDHFKIMVSDSVRVDPIELENRSTGLQWFFSFF